MYVEALRSGLLLESTMMNTKVISKLLVEASNASVTTVEWTESLLEIDAAPLIWKIWTDSLTHGEYAIHTLLSLHQRQLESILSVAPGNLDVVGSSNSCMAVSPDGITFETDPFRYLFLSLNLFKSFLDIVSSLQWTSVCQRLPSSLVTQTKAVIASVCSFLSVTYENSTGVLIHPWIMAQLVSIANHDNML
jgi:hypothetical protein